MKIKLQHLTAYFSICFIWLGLLSQFISSRFGGVVYIGISYAILLFSTKSGRIELKSNHIMIQRTLMWLIVFSAISFLGYEFFVEKQNINYFFVFEFSSDSFNIMKNIPLWCAGPLLLIRDDDNRNGIVKVFWIILAYNVIVTLVALHAVPAYAKNTAAAIITPEMQRYINIGAMGYDFTYAIAILVPIIFYMGIRNRNSLQIGFAVLCCYFIYKCSFLIALVALTLNILSFVTWKLLKGKMISKLIAVSLAAIFVCALFQTDRIGLLLLKLSQSTDSVQLSERLYDLSRMLLYNDTSGGTLNRFGLYSEVFTGAIRHPLFGTVVNSSEVVRSGHSTFLDSWSLFGIFGLIPFLLMIYYAMKYAASYAENTTLRVIIYAAYVTFTFISIFNPVLASPQILFAILWAIPMLARNCDNHSAVLTT